MKLPAIVSNGNKQTVLVFSDFSGVHINGEFSGEKAKRYNIDNDCTNITHKYLSNTWGVVESKEHAEFIIELAELHGFELSPHSNLSGNFFSFDTKWFCFLNFEFLASQHCKKITIPSPPKAELPEAGHNLVFAAPECKEWPCVGDEVCWGFGEIAGVVKCIDGDSYWIASPNGGYVTKKITALTKPKTPEEALRDDIKQEVFSHFAIFPELLDKRDTVISISECVSNELIRKYNITPKEV